MSTGKRQPHEGSESETAKTGGGAARLPREPRRARAPSQRDMLLDRITNLVSSMPEEAVAEALRDDDAGVLVRLASEAAMACQPSAVAKARARGAAYRAELIERVGGCYCVEDVAAMRDVQSESVRKAIRKGRLIGFPRASGYRIPAIQFHDGEEVRGLRDVLGAMTVASPWMRLHWLVSPEPRLGHGIPIEMLKQGQDKDLVRDAAELYAEQGAA